MTIPGNTFKHQKVSYKQHKVLEPLVQKKFKRWWIGRLANSDKQTEGIRLITEQTLGDGHWILQVPFPPNISIIFWLPEIIPSTKISSLWSGMINIPIFLREVIMDKINTMDYMQNKISFNCSFTLIFALLFARRIVKRKITFLLVVPLPLFFGMPFSKLSVGPPHCTKTLSSTFILLWWITLIKQAKSLRMNMIRSFLWNTWLEPRERPWSLSRK